MQYRLLRMMAVVFWAMLMASQSLASDYAKRKEVMNFIDEMVAEHQFTKAELAGWFSQAKRKQSIIDAISRPAEKALSWAAYRKIFVTESRISKGVEFWQENKATLERAEKEFGVPISIIVAILGVETRYGQHRGSYRVIDALSTLGFDYPRRASFFRKELKQFLLLAREQKQDPLKLLGSYAGAMGYGQFIPSSYRAYALDYSGDSFADIWNNPDDAIGSVANYFKQHGWSTGQPVIVRSRINKTYNKAVINDALKPKHTVVKLGELGYTPVKVLAEQSANVIRLEGDKGAEFWMGLHNFYVITRYNHSRLYAMAVWQLSQEIVAAKDRAG